MNYTVNISSAGTYTFEARVASPFSGGTFHVEVDGIDRTGPVSIPNTGSGSAFQFVTVNDIWLDAASTCFASSLTAAARIKAILITSQLTRISHRSFAILSRGS